MVELLSSVEALVPLEQTPGTMHHSQTITIKLIKLQDQATCPAWSISFWCSIWQEALYGVGWSVRLDQPHNSLPHLPVKGKLVSPTEQNGPLSLSLCGAVKQDPKVYGR